MRRLVVLVAVLAVGASAALATGAGAERRAATELTFDFFCGSGFCSDVLGLPVGDDWLFMGQVESPKRACRVDRRVAVFEKLDGPDKKMGSDRSNSRGTWLVRRPDYTTTTSVWYAKTAKKKLARGKRCKPDRSPEIAD